MCAAPHSIVIAGKNNIAVEICAYIINSYPDIKVFGVINATDDGRDSFQRSYWKYLLDNDIEIITLKQAYHGDSPIFLSLEFDKLVNPSRFSHDRLYNIHFSLLPAYKGMFTSVWPLLNGEKFAGATLHHIDSGIDTGDIIDQEKFSIADDDNCHDVYHKYMDAAIKVVYRQLDAILSNEVVSEPQSVIGSSYYSRNSIDFADITIDFNKTAWEVHNQVRAFTFRYYQLAKVNGFSVFGTDFTSDKSDQKPGTLLSQNNDYFLFATVDYNVKIFKDRFDEVLECCKTGDLEGFKILIKVNPKYVNEKNRAGWSPVIVAAYNGHRELIEYILSVGGKINDVNNKGTSVLMYAKDYAELNNDYDFIDFLINLGADFWHRDHANLNVLDYVIGRSGKVAQDYFDSVKKDLLSAN